MTSEQPKYLTVSEVADELRLSAATVRDMLRNSAMPGIQIRGTWRIDRKKFYTMLDELEQTSERVE
tara:strand:- start:246 stop:443 length:198 start_codon:yes stop_codon:yes gene_type:complete